MAGFRVMTYNVRYFAHRTRGVASTAPTVDRIARAIASLDPVPDVICLQEVETASLRANVVWRRVSEEDTQLHRLTLALREALAVAGKPDGYAGYYFPAHAYRLTRRRNFYTTGLAILAHGGVTVEASNSDSPLDITCRRLRAIRRLKQTRIGAHLRLRSRSGASVDVFNTHLSLPAWLAPEFWRPGMRMGWGRNQLEEARNLADFVDAERASDRFFVVGDLNSLPGSPAHAYLTSERGLRDAFADTRALGVEESRRWPTAGFMHLRMHLDHVLSGAGLEWTDFDDTRPFGDRSSPFHGLSDHVPLIGRCRLRA